MEVAALLTALRTARPQGRAIAGFNFDITTIRRLVIGTKDRETGGPHAPVSLSDSLNARFKLVWDDGRVSRGVMERRAIESDPHPVLASALAAAYDDPDARTILGPSAFPDVPTLDPGTVKLAEGAIDPFVPRLEAIRARLADHGLKTWSGSMQAAHGNTRLLTSAGLDVEAEGTSTSWSVSFDGESVGAGKSGRRLEPFEEFALRLDRLVTLVLALRGTAPARPGGVVPVLFHPGVVEDYVLAVLLHNLDGEQVAHGTGAFTRAQFGSGFASLRPDLTLRTDPLVPFASGAYRFTREGVPAAPVTLIDRGRLATPMLDLKYARRLGLPPNAPPAAMDTLFFEGALAIDEPAALGAAAGGVLVLGVLGVHTQDFTSGDFSLSAPQSLAIGANGFEGRLRGTVSGNLFELLRSDDLAFVRFPGETTPGLLVRCRFDAQ
ncbi:MAG TPA: metallopeptidase TldD-related protein [Candidatus Polarisedimenticolaceae bacterium]|nr:metallopeptidase TldD-related protein [Candidatus Polarisedimenticolaceae bacterium]